MAPKIQINLCNSHEQQHLTSTYWHSHLHSIPDEGEQEDEQEEEEQEDAVSSYLVELRLPLLSVEQTGSCMHSAK